MSNNDETIEVLDEYELEKGLVHVIIYKEPKSGLYVYRVIEPTITDKLSNAITRVREYLLNSKLLIDDTELTNNRVREAVKSITEKLKLNPTDEEFETLVYYVTRDSVGYGKINPLLWDGFIEDIHINGPGKPVYVWHSKYENLRTNIVLNEGELDSLIIKVSQRAGKNISSAQPILEGLLPEGVRVEVSLKEVAPNGPILTIRKFRSVPFTIVDLVSEGVSSAEIIAFLWFLLEHGVSMIIIGPTGAGKTTLLNALLFMIRPEGRVVTVEDTREINIPHEQWVPLVTRESSTPEVTNVGMYDLVKLSMRIRPDYLVIGELRGEEAYVFFQAMASGHVGLTTIHAGSIDAAVRRLISKPMNVPRALLPVASIFIEVGRVKLGNAIVRRVLNVMELLEVRGDKPITNPIYVWDRTSQRFVKVGGSKVIADLVSMGRVTEEEVAGELERRRRLIEAMAQYGFKSPEAVFRVTRNYYVNPEGTYRKVLGGELP